MKIIGKTERGFILDAEASEVAHLIGFYSRFDLKGKIEVGSEIEVDHMYDQLYELSHMEDRIQRVADTLEKYASELRPICPIHIECPTKGE